MGVCLALKLERTTSTYINPFIARKFETKIGIKSDFLMAAAAELKFLIGARVEKSLSAPAIDIDYKTIS